MLLLVMVGCRPAGAQLDENGRGELQDPGVILHKMESTKYDEEYFKAVDLLREKRYEEVIAIYKELILKEEPQHVKHAYLGLASTYVLTGDLTQAIENYEAALQRDSTDVVTYQGLSCAYYSKGDYAKALDYDLIALQFDSLNGDTHYGLAVSYDMLGNKERAKHHAKICIELLPNSDYRKYMEEIVGE